jgi:hypothetical protein
LGDFVDLGVSRINYQASMPCDGLQ